MPSMVVTYSGTFGEREAHTAGLLALCDLWYDIEEYINYAPVSLIAK